MKSIEFNEKQLEAYKNGATKFIVPIDKIVDMGVEYALTTTVGDSICGKYENERVIKTFKQPISDFIKHESKVKVNDTFFIQEDFIQGYEDVYDQKKDEYKTWYKLDNDLHSWMEDEESEEIEVPWISANKMEEQEARFKNTCSYIEFKKVQDLELDDILNIGIPKDFKCGEDGLELWEWLEYWFDEQHGSLAYDNNPYVFIYTHKGK
ncbi:hypothetical protein [Poseidonibacter lekithochrous]|uniref:hypothetical protein n=1 Tax=Poseidonibacter lekithochrous TaxID=1904463 RepID=UPI000D34FBDD|nr:hypothetical protein [Poseidonibacter lekithochrous]